MKRLPDTGHQALRSEQLLLSTLIPKREPSEVVVIHHVADKPYRLQLEIERRSKTLGLSFERIVL